MMSSTCSSPTESRTKSSVTPVASCSSGVSCWCVVDAGWITRLFASPMFARCEKSLTGSMNFFPASSPPLMPKPMIAPQPAVEVLLRQGVRGVGRQPGVVDPGDLRMLLQKLGHRQRVLAVALHPQVQRLEPLQEQKGVEGAHGRPQVAQQLHAHLEDEGDVPQPRKVPERLPELHPVVGRVGLGELGELPVPPVELPRVDDDAADGRPVAADELRGRVDHRCPRRGRRAAQDGGGHRVVHHQRDARVVGDLRDRLEVGDVELAGCRSSR